ncbi:outer membrane beta-barrel protein [Campylobacter lari]|nr:outer membrane beta-barrel protein [Campylobacter lari]
MKIIKKSIFFLLLFATLLNAENNGFFIGGGISSTGNKDTTSIIGEKYKDNSQDIVFNLIVGYKYFYTPQLGARIYFNHEASSINYGVVTQAKEAGWNEYTINLDTLYNFTSNETNMGVYGGLFAGYTDWDFVNSTNIEKKGFISGINFGTRANFNNHHSIELGAKIPFIRSSISDCKENIFHTSTKTQRIYSTQLKYIYSF